MSASILAPTPAGIARAAALLRRGALVGMPTETVYGLAARALDVDAVGRVFAVKDRPLFDPLIVHVAPGDPERAVAPVVALDRLSGPARATARALWAAFWPGPLTVVLPRSPAVHDLVTAGLVTVAVRMPDHPVAAALIAAVGEPLAAPSANRFGRISPTSAEDVVAELGDRLGLVLDGGRCAVGVESTVVALTDAGEIRVLRPGGVGIEALARIAPTDRAESSRASPGHTASHYAPRTPLVLVDAPLAALPDAALARAVDGAASVAVLAAVGDGRAAVAALTGLGRPPVDVAVLSPAGDPADAARSLFAALRRLDASGAARILAEPWPDPTGLGHAIADRLRRAAGAGVTGGG